MTAPLLPNRGWRGSADLWLDAAYDLLIASGVDQVKVMPLAKRLGLSRTSFYWHFPDREALLTALIQRWQSGNTVNLIARSQLPAATLTEAVLNLFDCWVTPALFDSELEFAMRHWARSDPALAATFASADSARIDAICALFSRFGFATAQADIRAHTLYLTQVGYISMRTDEPLALRIRRIPGYVESFTGQTASPAEIAAFVARHPGPSVR